MLEFLKHRKEKKELAKTLREQEEKKHQELLAELEQKQSELKKQITEYQKQLLNLEETNAETFNKKLLDFGVIESSHVGVKKYRADKIRKQTIEVEVRDGERSLTFNAKVNKFYLEWGFGKNKQRVVITDPPEYFERDLIPHLWVKRGIKYTVIKGTSTTYNPLRGSFKILDVEMTMELVNAIKNHELINQTVKASKPGNYKQFLMFILLAGFEALLIMIGAGGYGK